MYQSNPELMKLQQEPFSVEQQLKQLQHKQHRLENRKSYYEKADRKKRTHRLCTIAGTTESIVPEIKELTLPAVNELLESILNLPEVRRAIYNAVLLHREKEDVPIGPVSSERNTDSASCTSHAKAGAGNLILLHH